ncbi:Ribosome biogenesis protein WDR12 [Nymphon striatum]|nr:Ribosome biogenesis protein WDR12 [Nymphon striatum]
MKYVKQQLGPDVSQHIFFMHALLGCDTTSQVYGIGKGASLKKFKTSAHFRDQANVFDRQAASTDDAIEAGEKALACLYNGNPGESLNVVRHKRFCQKVASNTSHVQPQSLPPTSAAAKHHSLRVYYQVQQWKGIAANELRLGYAVADTPFSVQSNVNITKLSSLINQLLSDSSEDHSNVEFDFLINSKLLRENLGEHIIENQISEEDVLNIEYIEKLSAPKPKNSFQHDDWVSAVHSQDQWILTGCYDNTIHIWSLDGERKLTLPGHSGPIKALSWLSPENESLKGFVSVSQDQTAILWKWNEIKNSVECVSVCRGHARSVDCVAVNLNSKLFVTGSWDKMIKIWKIDSEDTSEDEQARKRQKTMSGNSSSKTKTPILTLSGHHENVSSVQWIDTHEICSSSWDHSIIIWDAELGGMKSQLPSSKAIFNISYSQYSRYILSASADRHIRLWDPRVKDGSVIKSNYTSHTGWVTAVHWSPVNPNYFISGSHDNLVKLWDTRLGKTPLYDLTGHCDKVLCVDWSLPKYVLSGSSDNTLKIFQSESYSISSFKIDPTVKLIDLGRGGATLAMSRYPKDFLGGIAYIGHDSPSDQRKF